MRDRTGLWIFVFLASVYFVTFGGHFYSGDGIEMARTGESLVLRGELALEKHEGERDWGYLGRGGEYYAPYPLGQSLAEAPFIAISSMVTAALPLEKGLRDNLRHAGTVSSNVFITALLGWQLYRMGRRLGYDRRRSSALGLILGLGTMAWVYARQDFGDPLTAVTLLGSILFVKRYGDSGRRRELVWAGLCLGYSLFTKYQMVIYCPVIWIYMLLTRREMLRRRLPARGRDTFLRATVLLAAPVILFGLLDLAVNYWKFESFTATGYEQETSPWAGWSHLFTGLYGFLLSPGKSLFLYNPVLVLWPFAAARFHSRHRAESFLTLLAAGVTLVFFAPLYWWHGDWAWGPRYLFPLLPLLVLSLAPMLEACRQRPGLKRVLVALLVVAVAVNGLGMTVNFFYYLRALQDMGLVHDDWNFIPGLSPIAFHAHVVVSMIHRAIFGTDLDYVYRTWSDGRVRDWTIHLDEYSRLGRTPDYFFFKPYDTRLEQVALGLAGLLFAALALAAAFGLRRELRRQEGTRG